MSVTTATLATARRHTDKHRNWTVIIPTLVGIIARIMLRIREHNARRANIAVLLSMSDRSLKDIGLTRCDIDRIAHM